jgi:hypothetical protein
VTSTVTYFKFDIAAKGENRREVVTPSVAGFKTITEKSSGIELQGKILDIPFATGAFGRCQAGEDLDRTNSGYVPLPFDKTDAHSRPATESSFEEFLGKRADAEGRSILRSPAFHHRMLPESQKSTDRFSTHTAKHLEEGKMCREEFYRRRRSPRKHRML